jgi:hypothetical protein
MAVPNVPECCVSWTEQVLFSCCSFVCTDAVPEPWTVFIRSTNKWDAIGQRDVKSSLLLESWFKHSPSGWSPIHSSTLFSSGHQWKERSKCLLNIIYTSISTISCSTNIYLNINLGYTFLILTFYTGAWICFVRRADTSLVVHSTLSQLRKLSSIIRELILNDGGIAKI